MHLQSADPLLTHFLLPGNERAEPLTGEALTLLQYDVSVDARTLVGDVRCAAAQSGSGRLADLQRFSAPSRVTVY